MVAASSEYWHGTHNGYRNRGCRCGSCRAANSRHVKSAQSLRHAFVDAARASGCVDCGNKNLTVLHSDHVRGAKVADLSMLIVRCVPLQRLFDELDKCETRCANCHAIATRQRRLAA